MKRQKYQSRGLLLAYFCVLNCISGFSQATIATGHFEIEARGATVLLIICNQVPNPALGPFTTINLGGTVYNFSTQQATLSKGRPYRVVNPANSAQQYDLWFSEVPLINMTVEGGLGVLNPDLKNEEPGQIQITDLTGVPYNSMVGVRLRGNISVYWPKKSYRVQLREVDLTSPKGWANKDESVLGMRSDKRWLLLSMYNERLRFNNRISHQLWMDMHKLYYLAQEPNAKSTISTRYVNVFIDGRYRGIFLITENTDRKQLQLKKTADDGKVRGELYKGEDNGVPNQFGAIPDSTWAGVWANWELEYPDESNWGNMNKLSNFVQNTTNSAFLDNIQSWMKLSNVTDYFLFMNLLRATDNWGKNLFLAKYKEKEPYFYGVWDLDGTWGYSWNAFQSPVYNDLLSNDLINRIISTNPDNFKHKTALRWKALRTGLLSEANIMQRFDTEYNFLNSNGMYLLEDILKSRLSIDPNQNQWLSYGAPEFEYTKQWTRNRLAWMDAFFENWFDTALPASLVQFDGVNGEEGVHLSWKTVQESNVERFAVLRSKDMKNWKEIGSVSASGDSQTEKFYAYQDTNPESGEVYYRLQILDFDGSNEFSRAISVERPSIRPFSVYPNPSVERITLVAAENQIIDKVEILNTVGQIVKVAPGCGNAEQTIEVSELKGIYFLRVHYAGGSSHNERILVE